MVLFRAHILREMADNPLAYIGALTYIKNAAPRVAEIIHAGFLRELIELLAFKIRRQYTLADFLLQYFLDYALAVVAEQHVKQLCCSRAVPKGTMPVLHGYTHLVAKPAKAVRQQTRKQSPA